MGRLNIAYHDKRENLLIFIHGLFGSKETWKNKDGISILGLLYDGIIKDHFDIGEFEYRTNKIKKIYLFEKDQLGIDENAELLHSEINIKGKDYKNIILVGHSMGGLISKQYLLNNLENNKVVKYISIATPHRGSSLAKYASYYHNQIKELLKNNDYLTMLNNQWTSSQDKLPISYYFFGAYDKIVEKDSAIPFDDAKNIFSFAENHSSIVKVDKKNSVYINLKNILEEFIKENNPKKILMINLSKKRIDIKHNILDNIESHYIFNSISEVEKNKIFEISNTEVQRLKDLGLLNQFIKEYIEKIQKLITKAEEIVYTGIPLIPLIFVDGYNTRMIKKRRYIINYREGGLKEALYGKIEYENLIKTNLEEVKDNVQEVCIKFFYSFKMEESSVKLAKNNIQILEFGVQNIKIDGLTHYSQIEYISKEFLNYIRDLKGKGIKKIHLFSAVPIPLAFEVARRLETHDPTVIIYNYNSDNLYDWGIDIKNNNIIVL